MLTELDQGLLIYLMVFAFVLGTIMASFGTCMAERMAAGRSWLRGRSECDSCHHVLGVRDLVPVFSWLFSRGKCHYCGSKVPVKYPLTELLVGILFALVILRDGGIGFVTVRDWGMIVIALAVTITDFMTYEIPNGLPISGIILQLLYILASGDIWGELKDSLIGGFVLAGGLLVISLIMDRILKKDSMGGGDIKLFFLAGLVLGLGQGVFCLLLASIIGLIMVAVMKQNRIPFGPAISVAFVMTLFIGTPVINWYLSLFF